MDVFQFFKIAMDISQLKNTVIYSPKWIFFKCFSFWFV